MDSLVFVGNMAKVIAWYDNEWDCSIARRRSGGIRGDETA
jgi:hypothetical protein